MIGLSDEARSNYRPLQIRRRSHAAIYDDGRRQYVYDNDGYRVYGVWLILEDEPELPMIVEADQERKDGTD